ncbi:MAG TPA: DEAD/DEAH box helicase family protein, partial [Polyangia bacterium]
MSELFRFLAEWPDVHEAATRAAASVHPDPRAACFYARRALELALEWAFLNDRSLRRPYQSTLSALLHEPTFKNAVPRPVFEKGRLIIKLGNEAVHRSRPVLLDEAMAAVRELFHVGYWFARSYARRGAPSPQLSFDPTLLPPAVTGAVMAQTRKQLAQAEKDLHDRDAQNAALRDDNDTLKADLERVRAEIAAVKAAAPALPDTHDYDENFTRDHFIDALLREAGWPLGQTRDREFPIDGMPDNATGKGFVDYVLWGDDGRPLGLVEAKRSRHDSRVGQQQAKLYADRLEAQFGQRPVIFTSNGDQHWIWDDTRHAPRAVEGFYKKDELELAIQRRTTLRPLATAPVNPAIAERYYQTRAIRRVGEAFEKDGDRKALVVMATGAGKTRTVIALCDLLVRCNWVRRVLFLADRKALVKQAVNAFKRHLPDLPIVNLVTEKATESRAYASTYPTIMNMIDESRIKTEAGDVTPARRFGVGHFDLIVIDEAHRSIFQKYKRIFE